MGTTTGDPRDSPHLRWMVLASLERPVARGSPPIDHRRRKRPSARRQGSTSAGPLRPIVLDSPAPATTDPVRQASIQDAPVLQGLRELQELPVSSLVLRPARAGRL